MEGMNRGIEASRLFKEIMFLARHRMSRGFEDVGITAPQGMMMGILSRYGRVKISELSERLGLTNSTVSGIVDRLEKQGLVVRERSEEDKRVVYVSPHPKFIEMHKDFHKKVEDSIVNVFNRATPEEIDRILDGFRLLKRLLEDDRGK